MYRTWPHHPLDTSPPHGGPAMRHLYRVHYPDWHGDDDYNQVEAASPRGAAERWVEERFSDLEYPSCVEGLVVTGPGGTTETFDVEVRSEPVFEARRTPGGPR